MIRRHPTPIAKGILAFLSTVDRMREDHGGGGGAEQRARAPDHLAQPGLLLQGARRRRERPGRQGHIQL